MLRILELYRINSDLRMATCIRCHIVFNMQDMKLEACSTGLLDLTPKMLTQDLKQRRRRRPERQGQ